MKKLSRVLNDDAGGEPHLHGDLDLLSGGFLDLLGDGHSTERQGCDKP